MAQSVHTAGPKASNNYQVYRMSFTWNKPPDLVEAEFTANPKNIAKVLESIYRDLKCVYQLERGAESALLHYQGHLHFTKTKHRVTEVAVKIQAHFKGIHLSCDSEKGSTEAEFYCMKDDETKVAGPWFDSKHIVEDWSHLEQPNGWQVAVHRMIKKPAGRRHIIWIWEETGRTGKSEFATYLEVHHQIVGLGLKAAGDNFYAVSELMQQSPKPNGFIFDVPRSLPKSFDWADVYMSMEKIKDGNFLSTKYVPKKVLFSKSMHIIVFSNVAPDYQALSHDRWRIYKISGNRLIPHDPVAHDFMQEFEFPEPETSELDDGPALLTQPISNSLPEIGDWDDLDMPGGGALAPRKSRRIVDDEDDEDL